MTIDAISPTLPADEPAVIEIDLDNYVDPESEVILIGKACGGDPSVLSAVQTDLRHYESRGWCKILHMTDDLAVVRWYDQFVLTIADETLDKLAFIGGDA